MDEAWAATSERDVRDPIYGYLHLNAGEARIVESPYFQRLRYVKQNSTAHLTYPSATGSRFEHSLGVAELAGRAIEAALEKSAPRLRTLLIRRCFEELGEPQPAPAEARQLLRAMVRAAALLHDVGHLPFSHTFEAVVDRHAGAVLRGAERERYQGESETAAKAYHERASYRILEENGFSERNALFGKGATDRLVQQGTLRVLRPEPEDVGFRALHDLVDSDIDADRGEYLVRDGRLSGIGFGTFDQERLFSSMRICREDRDAGSGGSSGRGGGGGGLAIRPALQALSAVETLFQERVRLYKYLYFHNYVMFTDELLAVLMEWLLAPSSVERLPALGALDGLREFLKTLPRWRFGYDAYVHGSSYTDDSFVWELLRQAAALLDELGAQTALYERRAAQGTSELRRVHAALRALLNREKLGGSLWKQLPQWDAVHQELERRGVPEQIARAIGSETALPAEGSRLVNVLGGWCALSPAYRESLTALLSGASTGDEEYSVLIATRGFSAFGEQTASYSLVDQVSGRTQSLGDLSPYLVPLPDAWRDDIHTRIYVLLHAPSPRTLADRESVDARAQRVADELEAKFPALLNRWARMELPRLGAPPVVSR